MITVRRLRSDGYGHTVCGRGGGHLPRPSRDHRWVAASDGHPPVRAHPPSLLIGGGLILDWGGLTMGWPSRAQAQRARRLALVAGGLPARGRRGGMPRARAACLAAG